MVKNAQKRTTKRSHPLEVSEFIIDKARNEHASAKSIARAVEERFEARNCPSARTVEDMVAEVRGRQKSGPWRIWDAEPADAAVVLEALAELMRVSHGETTEMSQEDANWIISLSHAGVGDLPPSVLHGLAIQYQLRGTTATSDLDALIAFTPWRSKDAFERYRRAVQPLGSIPPSVSLGPTGTYRQLLVRLGFSDKTAAQAKSYGEALSLEGGLPWFSWDDFDRQRLAEKRSRTPQ